MEIVKKSNVIAKNVNEKLVTNPTYVPIVKALKRYKNGIL